MFVIKRKTSNKQLAKQSQADTKTESDGFKQLYDIVFKKGYAMELIKAWSSTGNIHLVRKTDGWINTNEIPLRVKIQRGIVD
ncbi:unnamed protein product [Allacma fusca]|uniref:Uncharacterized protein n=1 Tax=Allacma fusca TaxID=39272 RepID=A0A8J2PNI0_9HEXA|nr:unnamed protein product [Allacma fusca]